MNDVEQPPALTTAAAGPLSLSSPALNETNGVRSKCDRAFTRDLCRLGVCAALPINARQMEKRPTANVYYCLCNIRRFHRCISLAAERLIQIHSIYFIDALFASGGRCWEGSTGGEIDWKPIISRRGGGQLITGPKWTHSKVFHLYPFGSFWKRRINNRIASPFVSGSALAVSPLRHRIVLNFNENIN